MPEYKCRVAMKDGRFSERIIHADSVGIAKKLVADEGGFLVRARKIRKAGSGFSLLRQTIRPKDLYSFNQEFLTMLRAGLPVVMAFDAIIEKQAGSFFAGILKTIRDDISNGESVSNAFERQGHLFSGLYIAMLRSGEAGGNIPDAIEEYLSYFERSLQIRRKVKAASVYPGILSICSIFVVAFLIVFVVPAITGTFAASGATLPLFTRALLWFSEVVRTHAWLIILGGLLVTVGIFQYLRTQKGRLLFDTFYLKLPFLGELSTLYSTAVFTASLSSVLKSGLPLNQALPVSAGVIQNRLMHNRVKQAIQMVERGQGFSRALKEINIFPDMALRIISAGEEGGSLEKVLKDVAVFYEKDLESRLSMLTSVIEPALMVLMGIVIGFIMLAMYLPIFQMAGAMS